MEYLWIGIIPLAALVICSVGILLIEVVFWIVENLKDEVQ